MERVAGWTPSCSPAMRTDQYIRRYATHSQSGVYGCLFGCFSESFCDGL